MVDVRVALLLQNARQILDIVRGTFPGIPFSATENLNDCDLAKSAGERLSCLWSSAASLLHVPGQVDTAAAQDALTLVSDRVGIHQFCC